MAGAVELATAYIALVPSLKGASQKIQQELGAVDTASAGSEMGRKMGGGMVGSIKSLVGPAIGLLATGAFAGFIKDAASASDATDKFKATMSFAGMDTTAITKAKDAAKAYADQTVYDLPTIQNMTAQLASNGIKDFTGLSQAAGNLNAVAGGNADTFKSVAMVMTQTAGAGKLTTENWNQMSDAIPGAAGPLMKAMQDAGAYTGNFRDAMAKGQITSDEFNAALMKLGNQPVAVEAAKSTKTFEGAIGGLKATINSGLMGALNAMKPAITGAISGLSGGLSKVFDAFGAIFNLFKTGNFNASMRKALGLEEDSPVVGVILKIRDGVTRAFGAIKGALSGINFGAIFGGIAATIGPLIPQIAGMAGALSPVQLIFKSIQPLLPQLLGAFGQLASVIGGTLGTALHALLPVFIQLQGVFVRVFQQVLATVLPVVVKLITMLGQTFTQLIPIIVPIVTRIATLAATLVSQLAPILMRLISAVMPMVITIFGALAKSIGPLIQIIAGLLIPIIQALMPVVVTVFGAIANVVTSAMQIVQGIIQVVTGIITGNWSQVWDGIVNIVSGALSLVGNVLNGLKDIVFGALGGIGTWLVDSGKALIQGFIDGISGMVGGIGDAVGGVLGAVADFFPHSPAKKGPFSGNGYTTHSGKALAADFAKGILSSQDSVEMAASTIMTSANLTGKVGISSALRNTPEHATKGGSVVQHIHPTPGMSEMTIANVAAHSLNYQLRRAQ